jgi:hypothetical protein
MSKKFELVKRYYDRKLWTKEQVEAAVKYGWITDTERDTILRTTTITESETANE